MVASFLLLLLFQAGTRKFGCYYNHFEPFCPRATASNHDHDAFEHSMQEMGFGETTRRSIHEKLRDVGLSDSSELVTLATDFKERPEVFSSLLQTDFGFDPIAAHRTRAAVMNIIISETNNDNEKVIVKNGVNNTSATTPARNGSQRQHVNGAEESGNGLRLAILPRGMDFRSNM
jgi:hypothetical protein